MKYYTGIGSRETPKEICKKMTSIASLLSSKDYILRSGGADGADLAFESGADTDKMEIFLPWDNFNSRKANNISYFVPPMQTDLVRKYHPAPHNLKPKAWQFMSRNSYQVLGKDLQTLSDFIVCWTSNGKASGGTGQALRIAADMKIPIFNLFYEKELDRLETYIIYREIVN